MKKAIPYILGAGAIYLAYYLYMKNKNATTNTGTLLPNGSTKFTIPATPTQNTSPSRG